MDRDDQIDAREFDQAEIAAEKQAALSYVAAAFEEARLDGVDPDCVAQAALFTAFRELVETYGEEAAATYAEGLPDRIRSGGFSTLVRH